MFTLTKTRTHQICREKVRDINIDPTTHSCVNHQKQPNNPPPTKAETIILIRDFDWAATRLHPSHHPTCECVEYTIWTRAVGFER